MKNRIKELRKHLKLTQNDFATPLGVSDSAVGNWEKGRQIPPLSVVLAICNKYNVNRDWLERGVGDMFAASVDPDEREIQRRVIGDIFESLPYEKQKLIVDSLRESFERFLTKPPQGQSPSNTVTITAPVGGGVTIDQKIEKKD